MRTKGVISPAVASTRQRRSVAGQGPEVSAIGQREQPVQVLPPERGRSRRELHVAGQEHHRQPTADRLGQPLRLGAVEEDPLAATGGQIPGGESPYAGVLDPLIKSGRAEKGPDQGVPAWDNQKARTIFEQMLVRTSNQIDAVAAANDGLANAVVTALKAKKLDPIPLSGQDATAQGAQNIISGWQSGTVYKPAKIEANAAALAAIALLRGGKVKVNGRTDNGVRNVPSILANPIWITKRNINVLYKDGQLKKSEVCVGSYKKFC